MECLEISRMQILEIFRFSIVVLYRYLFVKKKVFNYSELHFSEVTSYKIHTLVYGCLVVPAKENRKIKRQSITITHNKTLFDQ